MRALRWILTIALSVGVVTETGPFTAAAMLLIFVSFEALAKVLKNHQRAIRAALGSDLDQ